MENENTDSFELFQLKKQVAETQKCLAQLNEKFLQLLSRQNTGTKAVVAVPNCEIGQDGKEKDDVDDAILYFCLCSLANKTATWFAVPPRGGVDCEGHLSPVFEEPREVLDVKTPFAVGSFIFLVSDPRRDKKMHPKPYRAVHYLDTQNVKEGWNGACPFVAKPGTCHFLVANDRIYAFEFLGKCNSLVVSFMDCHEPDRWQNVFGATGVCPPMTKILASTIEYAATTVDGKPGRRALLFTEDCRLTFDFDTKSCELAQEHILYPNRCGDCICLSGGLIFFLTTNYAGYVELLAYNHRARARCRTPVFGLDKYLPALKIYDRIYPQLRLVHLGNGRLCLVWTRLGCGVTDADHVRCTKFSVEVLGSGELRATDVSSQEYKVRGSFWNGLDLNKQQAAPVEENKVAPAELSDGSSEEEVVVAATKKAESSDVTKDDDEEPSKKAAGEDESIGGGSKILFVGNLSFDVEQADVEEFFKPAGEVVALRFSMNHEDDLLRGFGHVEFATAEQAEKALREMNGKELSHRAVRLYLANERGQGPELEVFVKGFDSNEGEHKIRSSLTAHFSSCGEIVRVSIPTGEDGNSKGFAYVQFLDVDSRNKALGLNGSKFGNCGSSLTVVELLG